MARCYEKTRPYQDHSKDAYDISKILNKSNKILYTLHMFNKILEFDGKMLWKTRSYEDDFKNSYEISKISNKSNKILYTLYAFSKILHMFNKVLEFDGKMLWKNKILWRWP